MGPLVWKALSAGAGIGAAAVANKVVGSGWKFVTGRPVPDDPSHPEQVTWKEALLFAGLTGLAVGAARVAALRVAAQYYHRSSGHLPKALEGQQD